MVEKQIMVTIGAGTLSLFMIGNKQAKKKKKLKVYHSF